MREWWALGAAEPVRVGLIGCGYVSGLNLKNCAALPNLQVVACSDLDMERARQRAREFGVPRASSVDDLINDPEVEVVLNLTVPLAHAEVNLRAVEVGKHVYSEKPFAVERAAGRRILDEAARRRLLVGCAPDTFMRAGLQACRHLIDRGDIGRPVAATDFFMSHGIETWHPDPDFFFQPGAGPLFDMGPYTITDLVSLVGPVRRVMSMAQISFPTRTITSAQRRGEEIPVRVPTHVAALLELESGAIVSHVTSWDVWHDTVPDLEIYGTHGSLGIGDPTKPHTWTPRLRAEGWKTWRDVAFEAPYPDICWGMGLADMARAIRVGGAFRPDGRLGYHVLDVMCAIHESAEQRRPIDIVTSVERPAPLPVEVTVPPGDGIELRNP